MVNDSKDDDLHDREHSPLDSESNPGAIDDETFARAYEDALNDEIKKKATNLAKKTLREQERKAAREKWKSENPDLDKFLQFNLGFSQFSLATKIVIVGSVLFAVFSPPVLLAMEDGVSQLPKSIVVAGAVGGFGGLLTFAVRLCIHRSARRWSWRDEGVGNPEHEWMVFRRTGKFTGNLLHEYEAEQEALQKIGAPSHIGRLGKAMDEWQRTRKNKRLVIAFLCIVAILLFCLSRLV